MFFNFCWYIWCWFSRNSIWWGLFSLLLNPLFSSFKGLFVKDLNLSFLGFEMFFANSIIFSRFETSFFLFSKVVSITFPFLSKFTSLTISEYCLIFEIIFFLFTELVLPILIEIRTESTVGKVLFGILPIILTEQMKKSSSPQHAQKPCLAIQRLRLILMINAIST